MQHQPQVTDGKLPIFVFPTSLTFFSDDQSSHKQVLTLYNPYDFPLKFKVLSTTPRKYTVVDSEGTIRPRCCVDVVIRHVDICINNEGVKDKFRIQVSEYGQRKILGKKDVMSVLFPKRETSPPKEENFHSLSTSIAGNPELPQTPITTRQTTGRSVTGPSYIIIFTAVMCIAALAMPTHGEKDTKWPEYLHLSLSQKLIAAYILGLVTMVILKV
ncbi:motile sperm domain-containing protein 1 [Patella vulgata]|uniref:motile sperm domain-containing protein 1 n=1 Tax=Patella vulgata TaxID=6465 RepID=UPI00218058E5|nr:motile sperm domain-containing protein 1 [Patella vulgata]